MKLAIYGRDADASDAEFLKGFFGYLKDENIDFYVEKPYKTKLSRLLAEAADFNEYLLSEELVDNNINYIISMGGDGTLLDTLSYIKITSIPVMGINLGRLGFLSSVQKEDAIISLEKLANNQYKIEKRGLLELHSGKEFFKKLNYALNDFTIHKSATGAMVEVDTYLNGEFFNTFWADGLIVSTATGSTAYSLSCGGPIIFPDSGSLVITPVAPHNLTIRPIVVSDDTVISFKVRGRGKSHLISLDSRYEECEYGKTLAIQKAPVDFRLIKLDGHNFINTLREKLGWGFDSRNP